MPYYTEKQIDQARSIDLLTYLQSFEPTELVHVRGNTYCTREVEQGFWRQFCPGLSYKSQRHAVYGCHEDSYQRRHGSS